MKIFEWVQRKLSSSSSQYCRVSDHESTKDVLMGAKNGGKSIDTMLVALDSEKDALLLHQTLSSMLSVGTLGHADLFCNVHQQQEVEPPAKVRVQECYSGVGRIDQLFVQPKDHSVYSDMEAKETLVATKEESAEPLLKETKERREERITLADLFAVDDSPTDVDRKPCKTSEKVLREQKKWKKRTMEGKESPTTAKTIMATNKLRLITRMLKKKIHPDVVLAKGVSDVKWDGAAHEEMTNLEANTKEKWLMNEQVSTMEMS